MYSVPGVSSPVFHESFLGEPSTTSQEEEILPDFQSTISDTSGSDEEHFDETTQSMMSDTSDFDEEYFDETTTTALKKYFEEPTLTTLIQHIHVLKDIDDSFFDNQQLLFKLIDLSPHALHYIRIRKKSFLMNEDTIFKLFDANTEVLHYIDESFFTNRDFGLKIVRRAAKTIIFFREFHDDREFILEATVKDPAAFLFTGDPLIFDKAFKQEVLQINPDAKEYMSPDEF